MTPTFNYQNIITQSYAKIVLCTFRHLHDRMSARCVTNFSCLTLSDPNSKRIKNKLSYRALRGSLYVSQSNKKTEVPGKNCREGARCRIKFFLIIVRQR